MISSFSIASAKSLASCSASESDGSISKNSELPERSLAATSSTSAAVAGDDKPMEARKRNTETPKDLIGRCFAFMCFSSNLLVIVSCRFYNRINVLLRDYCGIEVKFLCGRVVIPIFAS